MNVLHPRCCGIDVHKKTVVACLRVQDGRRKDVQVRSFGTTTADLLRLQAWLIEAQCTHVAMESTGVYWQPVFNVLEGASAVVLANAHHIKAVPGRKTDVKDCEWLAELLAHGLIRARFIPPPEIRELRDLTRQRKSLGTGLGNNWLRTTLLESAWAATLARTGYLRAKYRRISRRRGPKRAAIAVAHSILVIAYHVLHSGVTFEDLGADYFDRLNVARARRYHLQRLAELGCDVSRVA